MVQVAQAPAVVLPSVLVAARGNARTVRPALTDLRFKGDAWLVDNDDGTASLCLGNYPMLNISICTLDIYTLNRTLQNVRFGQARRVAYARRRGVV